MDGTIDLDLLRTAWVRVSSKYEALRATIQFEGLEKPRLRILDEVDIEWHVSDVSGALDDQRIKGTAALITGHQHERFATESGPLWGVDVLKLGRDGYQILWTYHHVLLDAQSRRSVIQDVAATYESLNKGLQPKKEEPLRITDFLQWLETQDPLRHREFWKRRLDGFQGATGFVSPVTNSSAELPTVENQDFISVYMTDEESHQVRRSATELRASLPAMLLAAWALLLGRYSNETDVLFGLTRSGRSEPPLSHNGMVGCPINTIPFRIQLEEEAPLQSWLRRIHSDIAETRSREHTSLSLIRQWAGLPPNRSVFETAVVINDYHDKFCPGLPFRSDSFRFDDFDIVERTEIPLLVQICVTPRIGFKLEYHSTRFSETYVNNIATHYRELLLKLNTNAKSSSAICLLDDKEFQNVVHCWNDRAEKHHDEKRFVALFEEQAKCRVGAIAVECGTDRVTYGELASAVSDLARELRQREVKAGTLVGVCLQRSISMVVALLAIVRAGAAYLPLDPANPEKRLSLIMDHSELDFLLADDLGLSATQVSEWPVSTLASMAGMSLLTANRKSRERRPGVSPSTAYVIYTSGSTGAPKGVVVPHRALTNLLVSMRESPGCSEHDRFLAVTTISFDISALELYLPLISGARLVLASSEEVRDPVLLAERIRSGNVTQMQATPTTFSMLFKTGWRATSGLKVLIGGEKPSNWIIENLLECGAVVWNMYGPTETTIWSTIAKVTTAKEEVPIGRAIDNTTTYVLDRHLNPVPAGVAGELYIGGEGVADGYLAQPELTSQSFVISPFGTGEIIYRTGDLARYDEAGILTFIGRNDTQVKVRGFRVELEEIERAVVDVEGIDDCTVVQQGTDGDSARLVAFYLAANTVSQETTNERIRESLKERLPTYMIPAALVRIKEYPVTSSGKTDRRALTAWTEVQPPKVAKSHRPPTPLEARLVDIWSEVLGISNVTVEGDFFELGGDSLRAVALMLAIEREFGVRLPISTLVERPSPELLSRSISTDPASAVGRSIVALRSGSAGPCVFLVHDLDGDALLYRHLAKEFKTEYAIYGVRSQGTFQLPTLHTRIEAMASHYVQEIRSLYPGGTYVIGGLCAGGVIAFEMACQLQRLGERVSTLVILDALEPEIMGEFSNGWNHRLSRFTEHLDLSLRSANGRLVDTATVAWRKMTGVASYEANRYLQYWRDTISVGIYRAWVEKGWTPPRVVRGLPFRTIYRLARRSYKPGLFNGKILLVRATREETASRVSEQDRPMSERTDDPLLGWGGKSTEGVKTIDVAAGHSSMLKHPHAAKLARALETHIDSANRT